MTKQKTEQTRGQKLTTVFLNTDAVSNGDYSYHDAWIRREVIVTSGESFYRDEIDRIALGATVFVYANGVGVVAAGTVLDMHSRVVTDPAELTSPEPQEYQRKVSLFADIARNPVPFKIVKELCGTPSRAVRSIVKGKDALLGLVVAHACVFQTKLDAHSTANWTLIPRQSGQRFQGNLDTDSASNWTV